MRITEKDLKAVCARINTITNSPDKPYLNGVAQIGNFHVSSAYGGWNLQRMVNKSGGVNVVFSGYQPKKDLYNQMHAFISGLNFGGETP